MPSPPTFTLTPSTTSPPTSANVLITGGTSGIGLAVAQLLHTHPRNTLTLLDLHPPPPSSPLSSSRRCLFRPVDVTSWATQRSAFQAAVAAHLAPLTHVFVNAGLNEVGEQLFTERYDSAGELAEPERATLDVDLRHVVDTIKLAIYHLRADRRGQAGGTIVLTASLAGYLASAGAPLYSAAKHGVVGLMRALKGDCATLGISVAVVAPGITLTPLVLGRREGQSLEEWGEEMRGRGVPINDAETVARAVVWLMGMRGLEANGRGLLIQGNRMVDMEAGLAKSRDQWMGEEMLGLFRGGRNAPLFPNKL